MSTQLKGYVQIDDFVYSGSMYSGSILPYYCYEYNFQRYRVKYTDDCNVSVKASCTIDKDDKKCKGNIVAAKEPNCSMIPVTYKWRYCNHDKRPINIQSVRSKMKLNGKEISQCSDVGAGACQSTKQNGWIDTCSLEKTWLAINLFGEFII